MSPLSTVVVTGHAHREVPAERVLLRIRFQSVLRARTDEALNEAIAYRHELLARIEERHPDAEVYDDAIQVHAQYRTVEQNRVLRSERSQEVSGYVAQGVVSVEADVEDAAALIVTGGLGEHQTTETPTFILTPETSKRLHQELLIEAVLAAREEADILAMAAGTSISSVLAIGEDGASSAYGGAIETFAAASPSPRQRSFAQEMTDLLGEIRPTPVHLHAQQRVRYLLR